MTLQKTLETKLQQKFSPTNLIVINESYLHGGHAGDDGSGESHFRVKITANAFAPMSRLERHRAVYTCLATEIEGGLHALAVEAEG